MDLHAEMKYGHGQNTNLPIGILNNNPSTFSEFPARYCFPEQVPSILYVPGFHRRSSKLRGPGPVKAAAGCPQGGSYCCVGREDQPPLHTQHIQKLLVVQSETLLGSLALLRCGMTVVGDKSALMCCRLRGDSPSRYQPPPPHNTHRIHKGSGRYAQHV